MFAVGSPSPDILRGCIFIQRQRLRCDPRDHLFRDPGRFVYHPIDSVIETITRCGLSQGQERTSQLRGHTGRWRRSSGLRTGAPGRRYGQRHLRQSDSRLILTLRRRQFRVHRFYRGRLFHFTYGRNLYSNLHGFRLNGVITQFAEEVLVLKFWRASVFSIQLLRSRILYLETKRICDGNHPDICHLLKTPRSFCAHRALAIPG